MRGFLYRMILTAALALAVLFPAAAQRAASPAFPTEWRGNDKWCPQSDMPTRVIYTRHDECSLSDHITLTADRYERKKIVCRLLSGHEGMRHRGRIYHAVMSCQGEHERWFERADFFTPFPPDLLVVEIVAQASTLAGLGIWRRQGGTEIPRNNAPADLWGSFHGIPMALKELFSDEPWPQGGRTLGEIIERLATLGFDALVLGDAPCLTLTPPPIRATQPAPLAHRGQISA